MVVLFLALISSCLRCVAFAAWFYVSLGHVCVCVCVLVWWLCECACVVS